MRDGPRTETAGRCLRQQRGVQRRTRKYKASSVEKQQQQQQQQQRVAR